MHGCGRHEADVVTMFMFTSSPIPRFPYLRHDYIAPFVFRAVAPAEAKGPAA